jgi:hypothetical protein
MVSINCLSECMVDKVMERKTLSFIYLRK